MKQIPQNIYVPLGVGLAVLLGGMVLFCNGIVQAQGLDKAQAIQKALALTGLADEKQIETSAVEEVLSEADQPPFLKLTGHPIWRVSLANIKIIVRDPATPGEFQKPWHREDGGAIREHESIHSLDVLIDKATGKLIRIRSPLVSGYPSKRSDEEDLKASRRRYVGLPDEAPKVNLLEALQATYEGWGNIREAKQIKAVYVLYQTEIAPPCRDAPCPIWAIIFTGVSPIKCGPPAPPPNGEPIPYVPPAYLTMRHLVNAVTGDWMGASGRD